MPLTSTDRKAIFDKIKTSLEKCTPPMAVQLNKKDNYALMGNKEVPYGSSKKIVPGMYFASVVARKDVVSFYFFPIYMQEKLRKTIPNLSKYLKGKTCFTFKKIEQVDSKELDELLKTGIESWKKAGYMK